MAGTPYPIDRRAIANELGFDSLCENSLDAVSDRDFAVETVSALTLVMSHLSKICEELIRWSTPELGFVELSDAVTTGSSLMPQKKNPDVAELIRGRSGKVSGNLMALIVLLKGLPLSYNRDLQEDKEPLFSAIDTTLSCLQALRVLLEGTRFNLGAMREALRGDFSNATELADFFVKKGLPFRQAHDLVGRIVAECVKKGISLEEMPIETLRTFSPLIDDSVGECLTPEAAVKARKVRGGTSPSAVREQIRLAREHL